MDKREVKTYMKIISRFLGQALDSVKELPVEEQITVLFSPIKSPILPALKHTEVRKMVQEAILTQSYAYVVPFSVAAEEIKEDKYYRYEYRSSRFFSEKMVFFGKGSCLKKRYEFFDKIRNDFEDTDIIIYEYHTSRDMYEEMQDEVYFNNRLYLYDDLFCFHSVSLDQREELVARVWNKEKDEYEHILVKDINI